MKNVGIGKRVQMNKMKKKEFFIKVCVFNIESVMVREVGRKEAAKLVNSGKYYKVNGSAIAEKEVTK